MKDFILYQLGGITPSEWILFALLCVSVGTIQFRVACRKGRKNKASEYLQIYAIIFVIWVTLLIRTPVSEHQANLIPLWSWYRGLILNDAGIRNQVYANVVLFVPFGFFSYFSKARPLRFFLLRGFLLSLFIEVCQYFLCLGLFEWDDILHNSLGCLMGAACGKIVKSIGNLQQWHNKRGRSWKK